MPRTILTTVTAKDYKNLQQTYSEKNIINQTNGHEYVISTASKTDLTDLHGGSTSKTADTVSYNTYVNWSGLSSEWKGVFASNDYYLRDEWFYTTGSFSIETDQIITNPNTVSVKYSLKYDKYYEDGFFVAYNEWDSNYSVYDYLKTPSKKQNSDGYLSTDGAFTYEHSKAVGKVWLFGWQLTEDKVTTSFPANTVTFRVQKLANNHYKVTIHYRIVTWWGFNYKEGNQYETIKEEGTLFDARQIDFTISANTVEADEVEFNYSRPVTLRGGAKGKNYEMESNEFLQTDENTNPTQRQSATVSNEIFNKFDTDRKIVSFVLLNCEKYVVNDYPRYLQAEDLIYIKDENGQYIGEDTDANGDIEPSIFEVVKTRPIWDGTFSMEVTCRQIDMTS